MFFAPSYARAGFLSSILGDQVLASAGDSSSVQSDQNSQNMSLLMAGSSDNSCQSFLQDKSSKTDANAVDTSKDVNISDSGDCIVPDTSNVSASGDTSGDSSSDQSSVYVVKDGDTVPIIAKMFGVSENTIYWANDNIKKGDKLKEGQVLVILPISGIQHTITKGETIESIAKKYNADVGDIASFNGITKDTQLAIGDELIIPDAEMSDEGGDQPMPNLKANIAKDQSYYASHPSIKNDEGYFINPLPNTCYEGGSCRETQGLHDHYAVDLGAPRGTPIYAAAAGTVAFARTGWNGGYGNLVIIMHPNGTETYYAHQSKIKTQAGDQVSQGDVIGYVGSTGHSTGPHVHFEVRGARNPGVDWSWKSWSY
jgi:LysM repeat protein